VSNYSDGDFNTPYGIIKVRNPGPMNDPPYDNLKTYHQTDTREVRLQAPALRAFKAAELRITPKRMKRRGKVRHILITGVGYRSWKLQQALYAQEPGRFANPDGSMHVEALAVDVDMNQSVLRRARIKKALQAEGWYYAVDGEPWHASFRLAG
jgi:hypothetical protein